jgi:hypothetical protein
MGWGNPRRSCLRRYCLWWWRHGVQHGATQGGALPGGGSATLEALGEQPVEELPLEEAPPRGVASLESL